MWIKIIQSSDSNLDVIDHKFLLSQHSFRSNNRDIESVLIVIRKSNQLYYPYDCYKLKQKFIKHNTRYIKHSTLNEKRILLFKKTSAGGN